MELDVQFNLKKNPNYIRYLRENSYWYKYLNRNPNLLPKFIEEAKETYKLRPIDKITRVFDMLDTIDAVMKSLK